MPGGPQLNQTELKQWKLIANFRTQLAALGARYPQDPRWAERHLQQLDYLCLFLMALVNPVCKTLRAISAASALARMQAEVCGRAISLGSLSEAQHLVEPRLLAELIASLQDQISGPLPQSPHQAWQQWWARDSSIFQATSRMVWAQHGAGKAGQPNHAVRLHVSFHLWEEQPMQVAVTPGKVCERKVWREQWQRGGMYVGDRYFGEDYQMFGRLAALDCRFVLRLRDEAVVQVLEEIPGRAAAAKTGLVSDQWVRLGSRSCYHTARLRLLTIRKASGVLMRLITNVPPEQMSAPEVQTLYRRRWQIECFFRWLKCLLGCRHWLAESPRGVATQLYLAVIAGLLLQGVLGRRPNQRLWERLQFYLMGWATQDELMQAVHRALEQARSKKS